MCSAKLENLIDIKNLSTEEQEKKRQNLLKYCKLDTYAMVKIYEKLKEVTNFQMN